MSGIWAEQGLGDARERLEREQHLDRYLEHLRHAQRELEARVVVAALEEADRLRVDADFGREVLPAHAGLGAEQGDSVVYSRRHVGEIAYSLCKRNRSE